MARWRIDYRNPMTGEPDTYEGDFVDWLDRDGSLVATEEECVHDLAYTLSDKHMGSVTITRL